MVIYSIIECNHVILFIYYIMLYIRPGGSEEKSGLAQGRQGQRDRAFNCHLALHGTSRDFEIWAPLNS